MALVKPIGDRLRAPTVAVPSVVRAYGSKQGLGPD